MEFRSYNAELALANMMFKNIFSNIMINKTNAQNESKLIVVNCQLGQRSRVFKSWQNAERKSQIKLPMILINRTGYARQPQRLNNLHNEVKYEMTPKNRIYELLAPIPIDISYDVSIISKNPSDIDQIATNFMVFFNSDIYVTCQHPKYKGIKLNNQIIMSDSISEEHLDELDSTVDDLITSTFQFTFKTYLFGGTEQMTLRNTATSQSSSAISADPDNPYVPPAEDEPLYDGFIPLIHSIHTAWYPIPINVNDYDKYIDYVESMPEPERFRDQFIWKINSTISTDL